MKLSTTNEEILEFAKHVFKKSPFDTICNMIKIEQFASTKTNCQLGNDYIITTNIENSKLYIGISQEWIDEEDQEITLISSIRHYDDNGRRVIDKDCIVYKESIRNRT